MALRSYFLLYLKPQNWSSIYQYSMVKGSSTKKKRKKKVVIAATGLSL